MKYLKTIFFSLLVAFLAYSVNGQTKEDFQAVQGIDPTKTVKLFPNPAVEYLHVRFEEPIAKLSKLTVHNIIGNALDVEREAIDDHEIRLRVKDLPTGYYLLAVKDDNTGNRITLKFLKR